MKVIMTNLEILNKYIELIKIFNETDALILPIKVNYTLQKNIATLSIQVSLIEKMRDSIGKKFGTYTPDENMYTIPPENLERASDELKILMNSKEEVEIRKIAFQELQDLTLTSKQMQALLFMIEEE